MNEQQMNTSVEDIRIRAESHEKLHNCLCDDFLAVIKNKEFPLLERWDLFCEYGNLLCDSDQWIKHFYKLDGKEWKDQWEDHSRYETINLLDTFEYLDICRKKGDAKNYRKELDSLELSEEDVFHIMEQILQEGDSSFILDW